MPKFLLRGTYVGDGPSGVLKEGGSARLDAVKAGVASLGGTVECMYWADGGLDGIGVIDFPDAASAAAFSLMGAASGTAIVHTTQLLTAADLDEAAKKSPSFRPPGR